jgi:hypothetical protein
MEVKPNLVCAMLPRSTPDGLGRSAVVPFPSHTNQKPPAHPPAQVDAPSLVHRAVGQDRACEGCGLRELIIGHCDLGQSGSA